MLGAIVMALNACTLSAVDQKPDPQADRQKLCAEEMKRH